MQRPRSSSTIRVASAVRKARSWVTKRRRRDSPCRYSSSQRMASMSRWLVGSSSRSRCGSETSARPSSARRRQPPDKLIRPALGGQRQPRDDDLDLLLEPPAVPFLELGAAARRAAPCRPRRASPTPGRPPGDSRETSEPSSPSPDATSSKTVRSPAAGTSCSSRETRSPGSRQMVPRSGGSLPGQDPQQAATCRLRCGRSARCARPARSGGPLHRRAEGGRRRGTIVQGQERHGRSRAT